MPVFRAFRCVTPAEPVAFAQNLRPTPGVHHRRSLGLQQPPVIEIRDLHKSYGSLEVLKGVSLTAHRGEVLSMIGSSGSGKSTLLRCANLLEDSQQGDILFKGEAVH
jgi:ABC-type glutathione transport system ATPase component